MTTPLHKTLSAPLGNVKIDYIVSDIDVASDPMYVGYISHLHSWMIMKFSESSGEIRYKRGKSDYPTNWTNRASLSYNYYNE
jgi:hypothetical protein